MLGLGGLETNEGEGATPELSVAFGESADELPFRLLNMLCCGYDFDGVDRVAAH